jgi:hypothetical protein
MGEVNMDQPVKILHIDPDFKVNYFIHRNGSSIHSNVSLKEAINILKIVDVDLILSEPHHKVILTNQYHREV